MTKEGETTIPQGESRLWRCVKLLALLVGLVFVVLLLAMIRVLVQSQIQSYAAPDPMAYFQTEQPGSEAAHEQITEGHASVWIVRRSAFLPILDVAKVAPDLQDAARSYNSDMSKRLESAAALLLAAKPRRNRDPAHTLTLTSASHKSASLFSKQADYLNPEFEQVWQDLCLRTSELMDFRTHGRTGWVTFFDSNDTQVQVSESLSSRVMPNLSELPTETLETVVAWQALVTAISARLLKAPLDFGNHSLKASAQCLRNIDRAYTDALSDFLPRFLANDEFIILPDGVAAWFETKSRAELALFVAEEQWIRAAWTCHDDLKDKRLFGHYLKKAGGKGHLILMQDTLEEEFSQAAESLEDMVQRALR